LNAPPQLTAAAEVGRTAPLLRSLIETYTGDNQSPAVSQSTTRTFIVQADSTLLLGDAQLREALGVPSDVVLKTVIAYGPPPLPSPYLSRSSIFSDLARTLDFTRVAAVTGYAECGKTVAMAEFAAAYPGDVFWYSTTRSETHRDAWLALLSFSLARYVCAASFSPNDIRAGLVARSRPLLLVIDNAQHCHDVDALSFVLDAVEATPRIRMLLVGTDEPAFVSAVRSRGIVDWRLPGLTESEAVSLVELAVGELSIYQASALEFLRLRVDGHLGMLKLSRQTIHQIETADERDAFLAETSSVLSGGLASLQSAMIERLRKGLGDDEIELCRRLSIVLDSFPRRVGERVWTLDRAKENFHKTWNGCVTSVFEDQLEGRFSLPDLYRDGFRQEADKSAAKLWHGAVADAFEERRGDFVDAFDVHAAVVHRFLSGNLAAAFESASMYLALAGGPTARAAQAFLIRRFEIWLASSANSPAVPTTQKIRWHAIRARVYTQLNVEGKADSVTRELYDLLRTDPVDAVPETVLLGWSIVLMHAATSGEPEMALAAVGRIDKIALPFFEEISGRWREFLVICAYLNSSRSALPYLLSVMKGRTSESDPESLWGTMTGYEFWRAVTATIYSRSLECRTAYEAAVQFTDEIRAIAVDSRASGELEIALLFECVLAQIQIDVLKDLVAACAVTQAMLRFVTNETEARVSAYVYDTRGDALRCSGRDEEAVSSYMRALELWPVSEMQDKSETLLMLGITQAKLGKFCEGTKSACAAAQLRSQVKQGAGDGTSELVAARWLLEAAAFSVHGNDHSKACACLIAAHKVLRESHRNRSEWAALGQIAWSLINRWKPDPNNPQPPDPGFTLGLGVEMTGAEKMVSSAPTMMLARACTAVGRPHRALGYFEDALAECEADDLRTHIGIMALDAAIEARDLAAAVKYAAIGSDWLVHAPASSPQGGEAFVFDYLVGRAAQLALIYQGTRVAVAELDRAVSTLDKASVNNTATELLATILRAYRAARIDGDGPALEDAFQLSLKRRALWAARDIAWYWCFRFSLGRPAYENQYLAWHWRLCWISASIGSRDASYLAGVLEQERGFWNRIPEESRSDRTTRVLGILDTMAQSPDVAMQGLITELATIACQGFNVTDVSREVAAQLRLGQDASGLTKPLDALYIRVLDLVLHPGAPFMLTTLREDIALVLEGLRSSSTVAREAIDRFSELDALALVLEVGRPSEQAFEALRYASGRADKLGANSAAQLYTWLRHFIQFAPKGFGFDKISEILNSAHVSKLLRDDGLVPYVKIRLAACHLTAKAIDAQRRLVRALALIGTQQNMAAPIAISAVSSAEATRDIALEELATIVKDFQAIAVQANDPGLSDELWCCHFELGGVRRLTGSTLLLHGHDKSATDDWLKPSIGDFRSAVEAGKPLDSSERVESVLKAAFSGQSVARALNDETALHDFTEVIDQIRSIGGYDEVISAQESLEAKDILKLRDAPLDRPGFLKPDDEDAIQGFTDQIMQSAGWPADRRKFVEDDVRKRARIEQEQQDFCRHLQPLQNLRHTHAAHTVYASPTKYICSCSLLGLKTVIEDEDIDTVIRAMKIVHCDGCPHRSRRTN
jgi:tetratricopeptide (TPR) repeat protein